MPSVGTAYVSIRVNTKGFEAGLDRMMKRLSTQMEKAGSDLGKDFERGLKSTNFDAAFRPAVDAAKRAETQMDNSSRRVSDSWSRASDNVMNASHQMQGDLRDTGDSAKRASDEFGKASTTARNLGRSMGGIGGGSGGLRKAGGDAGFFSNKLKELSSEAAAGQKVLTGLYQTEAFVGTGLAGLIGGLSGAAQGIFALGANAAAAAPALGVLANGIIGLAQVGSVFAIASKGVGAALKAGFTSAQKTATAAVGATKGVGTAAASTARAVAAAMRAVRDARQGLQRAYQDAARAAADAARRTNDAEKALAQAQLASAAAQKALNAARAEGLQQLKEIGFAAEDAALAEDRAALSLEDAQKALVAASELAPDDRARVEAELSFKEADLNYREAKNRREQADKDQQKAARTGVEGTDAMISAHQDVADAQDAEAKAGRDLADARREQAQTAVDNAQRIADAQQALRDALQGVRDAQVRHNQAVTQGTPVAKAATTALDAYKAALAKLGPEQRRFVTTIIGMRGQFQTLRNQIAEPLFKGLNDALNTVVTSGMINRVTDQLAGTSGVLGDLAARAARVATQPPFSNRLIRVMRTNNAALRDFGNAGINLGDIFVQVADAARPLVRDFSRWALAVTEGWRASLRTEEGQRKLRDTMKSAEDRVREFWKLAVQLWRTLMILGHAANDAANGFGFIDQKGRKAQGFIPMITDNLDQFNDKLEKNPDLVAGFTQSLTNLSAAAGAIKTVFSPFIALGQDPRIATAFDTISKSDAFKRLGAQAGDAVPELAELVIHVADFLASLSESHSIDHFLDILNKVAGAVATFTRLLSESGILKYVGYVTGAVAAIRLLWRVLKIGTSPFVALGKSVANYVTNVKKARTEGKGFFRSLGAGAKTSLFGGGAGGAGAAAGAAAEGNASLITAIEAAAGRVVVAIDTCCVKLSAAMGRGALGGAAGQAARAPLATSAAGAASVAGGIGGAAEIGRVGRFAGVMGKFAKVLGPASKLMRPLSLGIRGLGLAFRFAMGPLGIILTLLPILWPLLVKIEEKTGIFSKTLDLLKVALGKVGDAFKWLWDKILDLFDWLKSNWDLVLAILVGPFGLAVRFIIQHWDTILKFIKGVPGKIKRFLRGVWNVFSEGLRTVWTRVQQIWGRIITWVKGRPAQFMRNLRLLWDIFRLGLRTAWDRVQSIWATITTWVKNRPAQFTRNMKALWSIFREGLSDAWEKVKTLWERIKTVVGNWPGQMRNKLSGIWDGIQNGLRVAYNWVAGKVNTYLIGNLNKVLRMFHASTIDGWPKIPGQAEGGPVRGPGGPKADKVLRRLSNGEYVLPTRSAQKIGPQALEYMRKHGELPPGGTGGIVGFFKDKYADLKGALAKGAETALKWVLSKFKGAIGDNPNILGRVALAGMNWVADKITGFGRQKDTQAAAAAGPGKAYTGPPGGWTYPLARRFPITQYPNSGHRPTWSVDIGAPGGTVVRAASRGTVDSVISLGNRSYGNYIVINHAGRQQTLYAHLQRFLVKAGQSVKTGQSIGISDTTGHSTGNHLHFELKPSNSTIAAMAAHGVRLGQGGVVASSPAGTLAVLAEAGRSERVTPLDAEGFTPAERRMLEALEASLSSGGGGDNYHVHPSQGMNETHLADLVARRVAWKRRRGVGRR